MKMDMSANNFIDLNWRELLDADPSTECSDLNNIAANVISSCTLWAWGFGKPVYNFDPDFADSCIDCEFVSTSIDALEYIPHTSVYINYKTDGYQGAFFHKPRSIKEKHPITIMLVVDDIDVSLKKPLAFDF